MEKRARARLGGKPPLTPGTGNFFVLVARRKRRKKEDEDDNEHEHEDDWGAEAPF